MHFNRLFPHLNINHYYTGRNLHYDFYETFSGCLEPYSFITAAFRHFLETSCPQHKIPYLLNDQFEGADLSKSIHILIGGESGGGKSCFTRNLLISLLLANSPEYLKVIICDKKGDDFWHFEDLCTYLEEPKEIKKAIVATYEEIAKRKRINRKTYSTSLVEHNARTNQPIPFIVLFIDELGSILSAEKDKEQQKNKEQQKEEVRLLTMLKEIISLGRSKGIFTIMGNQRPDVNSIPGDTKASMTTRMCFRTSGPTDTRVVLNTKEGEYDSSGFEDGMFYYKCRCIPVPMQSTYIDSISIKNICDNLSAQRLNYKYDPNVTY